MAVYLFPGQGSQRVGMGEDVFSLFPELVQAADDVLGYSIVELCLHDPQKKLNQTQITQPVLYVVNCLSYLKFLQDGKAKPDYLAGHSLGEYSALFAAGVFDFVDGLQLVRKRGELMSQVQGGGMAAVLGLSSETVNAVLANSQWHDLSIANFNSYTQQVISGPLALIEKAKNAFIDVGASFYVPLAVQGAFHSPFMYQSRLQFAEFLQGFQFAPPQIPVISNTKAIPYEAETIRDELALQIDHPVQWLQTIQYLLLRNQTDFEEIGPGNVLFNLMTKIRKGM